MSAAQTWATYVQDANAIRVLILNPPTHPVEHSRRPVGATLPVQSRGSVRRIALGVDGDACGKSAQEIRPCRPPYLSRLGIRFCRLCMTGKAPGRPAVRHRQSPLATRCE